ncbi:MAG: hypothetical protein AAF495_06360 [Pseudomonadota bacterium]
MYRLERSHIFLQQAFRGGGPTRAAVQDVLQVLRWDPLDDRLIAFFFDPDCEARAYSAAGRRRQDDRLWRFGSGPALRSWAAAQNLGWRNGADGLIALSGCWLLELSSCSLPDEGRDEAAIERYRTAGGRSLFSGDDGFYWACSYHLAVPGTIAGGREASLWHAEGGRYQRRLGGDPGAKWLRRRQAWRETDDDDRRPTDQFDPRAAYRLAGLGEALAFELAPGISPLALTPFIARLGHLAPWPPNPLLRLDQPTLDTGAQGRPLAAWFQPCADRSVMSWEISPPLNSSI